MQDDVHGDVRATRKLLQRLEPPSPDAPDSTTLLGDWYATYLPWRPRQAILLVNERTLLPLLMPLAPAATFLARFPDELARLLTAHHLPTSVIADESPPPNTPVWPPPPAAAWSDR